MPTTSIFSTYKNAFIVFVVLAVITACGFYLRGLYSTIEDLNSTIIKKDSRIEELNQVIAYKEVNIQMKETNIKDLKLEIDKQNLIFNNLKVEEESLLKKIEEYKNKPESIKYIPKLKNATCEELEKTSKIIGGLKYEDL